jgi:hypothetical protein
MKKALSLFIIIGFVINLYATDSKKKVDSTTFNSVIAALKSVSAKPATADTQKGKIQVLDSTLVVVQAGSLKRYKDTTMVIFGDYIYVKVNSLQKLLDYQKMIQKSVGKDTASTLILFISGNPMYDIPVGSFDWNNNRCVFLLDRQSKFLPQLYPMLTYMTTSAKVTFSVGFKNGTYIKNDVDGNVNVKFMSTTLLGIAIVIIALITMGFIKLAISSAMVRVGGKSNSQYSLALSQLAFWTLVITMSYFYIWISTQEMSPITGSTIILLAVSLTTATGAKLVDKQRDVSVKELKKSKNFFIDILSDEDGITINRAQMVLWTMIVGGIFIYSVVIDQIMPQIDGTLLGLMGISSLGYLGLKNYEPKPEATVERQKQEKLEQKTP